MRLCVRLDVSIPRSGFWVFKLEKPLPGTVQRHRFQSLGRDSGCSSGNEPREERQGQDVSIPRSGFWVFKPASTSTPAPST